MVPRPARAPRDARRDGRVGEANKQQRRRRRPLVFSLFLLAGFSPRRREFSIVAAGKKVRTAKRQLPVLWPLVLCTSSDSTLAQALACRRDFRASRIASSVHVRALSRGVLRLLGVRPRSAILRWRVCSGSAQGLAAQGADFVRIDASRAACSCCTTAALPNAVRK